MMVTIKEITLSILLSLSALLAGFAFEKVLDEPYWMAAIFAYAICFGLFLLLVKNLYFKWAVPAASVFLFSVFLRMDLFWLGGVISGALFAVYSVRLEFEDENASFKIFLKRRLGPSLKVFFTGLTILLAFIYYGAVKEDPNPEKLLLPETVFRAGFKLLEIPIRQAVPGFRADATTGEIFTPQEREAYMRQEVLYAVALARIKDIAGDYVRFVPVLAALSYLIALKTVSILIYYMTLVLLYIIVQTLIMSGIVQKIQVETAKDIYI